MNENQKEDFDIQYFENGLNQEFLSKFIQSTKQQNEDEEEEIENFLIEIKNLNFEEEGEEIKSLLHFYNKSQEISYFQLNKTNEYFQLQDIYGSNENEIDFSEECVVCLTNDREIALLPCRHNCICHTCFLHLDKCPICRTKIKAFVVLKPSIIKESEEIDLEEFKKLKELKIEK